MIARLSIFMVVYIAVRLISPLRCSLPARLGLCLLPASIVGIHWIFRRYFGGLASPELPSELLIAVGFLFGGVLFLFLFLIVRDLFALIGYVLSLFQPRLEPEGRDEKPKTLDARLRGTLGSVPAPFSARNWAIILVLLGYAVSGWGVWEAVRIPDVKPIELSLPGLPAGLDGTTIALVTDLHASAMLNEPRIRGIVDRINALQPDLIVFAGDTIDGSTDNRKRDIAPLRDLKARYGVFAATGNHEYYSGYGQWMDTLEETGFSMLKNAHAEVMIGDGRIIIAGITDPAAERFGLAMPDIQAALHGAPDDAFVILIAHRPTDAEAHSRAGVDLQLSGHTHGGQIIGLNLVVGMMNEGFLRGIYQVGDMTMYLSPGAGLWSGMPFRVGVPAEIALITLRRPDTR